MNKDNLLPSSAIPGRAVRGIGRLYPKAARYFEGDRKPRVERRNDQESTIGGRNQEDAVKFKENG
jgi:hypothetical protein